MQKELLFIDENNDNQKSIFHMEIYYDFIKELISVFFNRQIEYNEFHKHFLKLLELLEDYEDIYLIYSEMPFFWAMSIIENKKTNDTLHGEELKKYTEFGNYFKKKRNITSFIEPMKDC